jgi:hypothetical protein
VLNSQFRGSRVDTRIWRTGWFGNGVTGPINRHELACYSPANVSISARAGLLLRVTRKRSVCSHRSQPYTGAVVSTNPHDGRKHGGFAYKYGVLQAEIFLPATADSVIADWPSVVTFGQRWPRDGEDDIVENLGGLVCSHFHSIGHAPGGDLGGCVPGLTPGWSVVSSNWEPGSVTWYYGGIEVAHASRGITSEPMYIVLVNTVSGKSPQVARPDAMRVAYVRVWQKAQHPRRGSGHGRRSAT